MRIKIKISNDCDALKPRDDNAYPSQDGETGIFFERMTLRKDEWDYKFPNDFYCYANNGVSEWEVKMPHVAEMKELYKGLNSGNTIPFNELKSIDNHCEFIIHHNQSACVNNAWMQKWAKN